MALRERNSIRVLLLNPNDELLLLCADDPSTTTLDGSYRGRFWFPVGGALEPGETPQETALREVFEEAGIPAEAISLGPVVWHGVLEIILSGVPTRSQQQFLIAKTTQTKTSLDHLTAEEQKVITHVRWFSLEEIEKSDEIIYPTRLAEYLKPLLTGPYPPKPLEIDLS